MSSNPFCFELVPVWCQFQQVCTRLLRCGSRVRVLANAQHEPAGWFWNAYATALQYSGGRNEAETYFSKSIERAKARGWRRLEALAPHHFGRSLAEQNRFVEAESRISEALAIRIELNEPRQESSRRALVKLAALQRRQGLA